MPGLINECENLRLAQHTELLGSRDLYWNDKLGRLHLNTMFSVLSIIVFFLTAQRFFLIVDASQNVWSAWSSWSTCSAYDNARHTRFRKCLDEKGQILTQCSGLSKRTRQCQSCSSSLLSQNGERRSDSNVTSSGIYATKTAWCVSQLSDKNRYVEISFKNFVQLTGIGLQGDGNSYVKKYKIKYSYDGEIWYSYSDDEFLGNVETSRVFKNTFKSRLVTRSIRVYPTSYTARACFKVELYGCEYNCGGIISHSAPLIQAPSASERIEELNCMWRIESKDATKLQLKFLCFELFCKNGMLELYDGTQTPNNVENLEEGFCGASGDVSSQIFEGRSLWMHYNTNATTSDIGFNIQVNSYVVKTLNATSGQVTVPNTGYSNIYRYVWIITAPRDNDTIELTLDYFLSNNTRTFAAKCVADAIVINHGNKVVKKYCDTKHRKVFTSTNGFMKIKYKSKTDNPNWRIKFSYKILGYPNTTTIYTSPQSRDRVFTAHNQPERGTKQIPSNNVNDTILEATQKKDVSGSPSKVPVIVSSVLAVVIAIVCLIALVHYLKRRNEYLKKHPYDCSNRPMSHFGDQDTTPFINTNLLMWHDSKDSEKSKNSEKSKKSLPVVEVTLRENEPQRLSIIPPEMLKSANSEVSFGANENEETGTLKVSDNFTEECMKLLDNNLVSALEDNNDEYNPGETDLFPGKLKEVERYGSLPEADRRSPEVDDSQDSLPEAQLPQADKL